MYRLKKTWDRLSKQVRSHPRRDVTRLVGAVWSWCVFQTKTMIDKLHVLVSSESRFKNMRDALHRLLLTTINRVTIFNSIPSSLHTYRCDPPCIPYLGMYLTDLSFIEEGTPNFTDEGLVNFSKMRMVSSKHCDVTLYLGIDVRSSGVADCSLHPRDPAFPADAVPRRALQTHHQLPARHVASAR